MTLDVSWATGLMTQTASKADINAMFFMGYQYEFFVRLLPNKEVEYYILNYEKLVKWWENRES
jgi:hypothetical protein